MLWALSKCLQLIKVMQKKKKNFHILRCLVLSTVPSGSPQQMDQHFDTDFTFTGSVCAVLLVLNWGIFLNVKQILCIICINMRFKIWSVLHYTYWKHTHVFQLNIIQLFGKRKFSGLYLCFHAHFQFVLCCEKHSKTLKTPIKSKSHLVSFYCDSK